MNFQPADRAAPGVITGAPSGAFTGVGPGARGPEQLNQVRLVPDVSDILLIYLAEANPLLTLTGRMRRKREAVNVQYQWLEKDEYPRVGILANNQLDTDTTLQLSAGQGQRFAANYVLLNTRTREQFIVGGISTDQLTTCVRGVGGQAAPMNAGDTVIFTRCVYEDGAGLGTLKSVTEFNLFNYTETIRTPFGFTGRDLVTELFGGRDEVTETKWATIEHKKSIETAFFFGKRALVSGVNHQKTLTGGLENFILTNTWNVSGTSLNERVFNEFLEQGMKWGNGGNLRGQGTKYLFASSRWLTEINDWAIKKLEYRVLDERIGFSAMQYNSPHGRVMLLRAPLLDYNHPDFAFLLDLNHIRYAYLRQRDTRLRTNIQPPDADGKINEFLSDVGPQIEFEHAHSILKGISV